MWRLKSHKGIHAPVVQTIHKYSRTAYAWWIFAYISGFLMAMSK
jgi:hypothetical protein